MQNFYYQVGPWKARASVHEVNESKLLATICVMGNDEKDGISSQHTIVFDHLEGLDAVEETKLVMRDLLRARYQT